jgi:hypothetical protein
VGGDAVGDAFAAGQPGADELVGIGAVDLGARWAAGGAAGLARDRQDSIGFVDGRIAVQQFPGGAVDVIDAAAQQDGLDAPARLPGGASGEWEGGQWFSSRRALAGGGGRAEADLCQVQRYRVCHDQRCNAATGLARLPAAQAVHWCGFWHRDRAPGASTGPASHGHPALRGSLMTLIRLVSVFLANTYSIRQDTQSVGCALGVSTCWIRSRAQ